MLIQRQQSLVLGIDLQTRLAPAIDQIAEIESAACWILQVASELAIPVLLTEQYPKGLGSTTAAVLAAAPERQVLEKVHFSAWREPDIMHFLQQSQRRQIILFGTESHVCVLQTALDLLAAGYHVFVVEEATGSRKASDKRLALARLQQAGAQIISREMLAFEWLEQAGTDVFRRISQGWIR